MIYEIDAEDDPVLLFLSELILSIIPKTKKILCYFLMVVYSIVLHPFFTLDIGILSQIIFSWMNLQEKRHHFSSPKKAMEIDTWRLFPTLNDLLVGNQNSCQNLQILFGESLFFIGPRGIDPTFFYVLGELLS